MGETVEDTTLPRRSGRSRNATELYGNLVCTVMLIEQGEPTNYKEAMASLESEKWLEAMKSEIGFMYDNKVWTLMDIPEGRKAVENKWIFKKKTDDDGNVTVYKSRLVAKGFRQVHGSSVPALKIWQVHVYSANPWIDSFAHTVYDVISQQSINITR